MQMLIKVDRCLPAQYENDIEQAVQEIPYYYGPNTSYASTDPFYSHYIQLSKNANVIENGQFTHALYDNGHISSQLYGLIYPILYMFAEKAGIEVKQIVRVKINLLLRDKTFKEYNYNFPHSDRTGGEKVFLYYIHDCDGDTFIFDEIDDGENIPGNFTVIDRVTPKKGTGIFFDCFRYHASSNPSVNQHRYVINFNFV
jgi:hypothetical protein